MNRFAKIFAVWIIFMLMPAPLMAQQAKSDGDVAPSHPEDQNARDLLILSKWFQGKFDNEDQLWFQEDRRSEVPEDQRHERLHTAHKRLDLPAFGEHVFYVEEFKDNDPGQLVRQRLVIFSSAGKQGIRMQQGFFKNTEKAEGAHIEPEKLKGLKQKDVVFLDECDVFWKRSASQFEGAMRPKACVFGEGEKRRYSIHNLILSEDKYWRSDLTRLVSDDSIHIGMPEDQPHQLRRAISFICNISIREEDGTVQRVDGAQLHNQGGTITFKRDATGEDLLLRMRNKQYPYYESRPDFTFLSLRRPGEARSIAYAIGDPQTRRLGFNSGIYGVNCFRKGYTFNEPSEILDLP